MRNPRIPQINCNKEGQFSSIKIRSDSRFDSSRSVTELAYPDVLPEELVDALVVKCSEINELVSLYMDDGGEPKRFGRRKGL